MVYEIILNQKPFANVQVFRKKINEGKRPEFICSINESFKNLITKCWDENTSNRPSYNEIATQLKNKIFITKSTNEKEFLNYVKLNETPKTAPIRAIKTEPVLRKFSDTDKSIEPKSPKRPKVKVPKVPTSPVKEAEPSNSSDSD